MASVNKAILIGNLGKDPELKYLQSGQAVAEFSLATSEKFKDKEGVSQERTEWHNIVCWGRTAELAKEYLAKGRSVYIEGRIQNRSYDDKDGVKRYRSEVVAEKLQFLGGGRGQSGADGERSHSAEPTPATGAGGNSSADDDLPF